MIEQLSIFTYFNQTEEKMMKKLPIGIQTFSEIIKEEYLYVDKTKPENTYFCLALAVSENLCWFRRYLKSLLAIKAFFRDCIFMIKLNGNPIQLFILIFL